MTSNPNIGQEQALLAELIRTRLLGVHPQDHDLQLEDDDWRVILSALSTPTPAQVEPVAYRYVHLDYAGRKVSRYGAHPERVNGHDPIETHPLYANPPAAGDSEPGRLREAMDRYGRHDHGCILAMRLASLALADGAMSAPPLPDRKIAAEIGQQLSI